MQTREQKLYIEMESFFRLAKLKFHFNEEKMNIMKNETQKIKLSNLKATKNRHLINTITPSKHILKQQKANLNNREVSMRIMDTTTYLKVKELL